jgi:hypothetical protein
MVLYAIPKRLSRLASRCGRLRFGRRIRLWGVCYNVRISSAGGADDFSPRFGEVVQPNVTFGSFRTLAQSEMIFALPAAIAGLQHQRVGPPTLGQGRRSHDLLPDGLFDLPDGQISKNLSSPFRKNILIFRRPKSVVYPPPSRPTRGAVRDRHGRGAGCGGRGWADNERH